MTARAGARLLSGLALAAMTVAAAPPAVVPAPPAVTPAAAPGSVRIDVGVEPRSITVGDPITVTIRLTRPPGTRIVAFDPEGAFEPQQILDATSAPPVPGDDGLVTETRTLRVTVFRTGTIDIPAFQARTLDAEGKEAQVASAAVPVEVRSVLTSADGAPADIRDPWAMAAWRLWPWLVGGLLAVAAGAWAWWRRTRRRPGEAPSAPATPPRPAHEIAYAELERLLSSELLARGRVKEFYIELAEIVRRYIAARFGVDTFERTTYEILEALRVARVPLRVSAATGEFFSACDLVKFARYVPEEPETRGTVERAYRLVDETRPALPLPATPPEAAAAGAAS